MRFMRLTDEKSQLLFTTALRFTCHDKHSLPRHDIRRDVSTNTTASRCVPRAGRDVSTVRSLSPNARKALMESGLFEKISNSLSKVSRPLAPCEDLFCRVAVVLAPFENREAASVSQRRREKTRHRVGRVGIASRGTGTRLNFSSVSVVASLGTRYRRDQESSPRFERAPRGPSLGVRENKNHVFRLDRFCGPGQSLGRASCSSRRRISRRALLAV